MNIQNTDKTSLGFNIGTMIAMVIAIITFSVVAADMYGIVKKVEVQNKANGDTVNQTLSQLLDLQRTNNIRGNDSLMLFKTLLLNQIGQGNQTLENQGQYFPDFNESLTDITEALNITD